jgi:hypothetical protein
MDRELQRLLLTLMRSSVLRDRIGPLLHTLLLARLLAEGAHEGPPHGARRAPRHFGRRPERRLARGSQSGRRPRG